MIYPIYVLVRQKQTNKLGIIKVLCENELILVKKSMWEKHIIIKPITFQVLNFFYDINSQKDLEHIYLLNT